MAGAVWAKQHSYLSVRPHPLDSQRIAALIIHEMFSNI